MKQLRLLITAAFAMMLVGSCGGRDQSPPDIHDQDPGLALPLEGQALDGLLLRDASGKVSGIQINWEPVADLAAEKIVGYHIYRSDAAIDDAERGNAALWLSDDSFLADESSNNTIFPQDSPLNSGKLSFVDPATVEWPLVIGESWYYRISAVNDNGEESGLSPELKVDVGQHAITSISPEKAGIGSELVIQGKNFGQFDAATDKVLIIGNQWNDVTHEFDEIDIEPVLVDWQPTEITVEVPAGATKGRVKVEIDGLVAQSFALFENADPYITEITTYERFIDQSVQVKGANFGTAQDGTHFVVANDVDQTDATKYSVYNDVGVTFKLLQGTAFGEVSLQVEAAGKLSNTGYMFLKNRAPVAAFSMNKNSGKVPLQINFNAAGSSDAEGDIAYWKFNWGDGSAEETKFAGDTPSFSHIFEKTGSIQVTLTVEDGEGLTATTQKIVTAQPTAEVLLIENIDNGQGVGNQYVPNVSAIRADVDGLALDYISAGYSAGIGQVAIDSGFRVVIWFRGGPGPADPIQDWPRNWSTEEKDDLQTILNNGTDVLLISQNHQFTGDDSSGNDWPALYGLTRQTDRIQEPGGTRPFTWMFGCPTDITYSDGADSIPSSPVCLNGAVFPGGVFLSTTAAEQYSGVGSSGNVPTSMTIANNRIQMGLAVDTSLIGTSIHPNFVPGLVANEATHPFKLCYSHGLTTAPDSNIGFSGGGYSHTDGTARLWVIGWSYSEMTPTGASRQDVLQNILAWLDSGLTLP